MSRKNNFNTVFLKNVTGTIAFAVFFFVSALFVSFCFPVEDSVGEEVAFNEEEPENQDVLNDFVQEKEIQVESAVSKAMQSAVIQHSRLEDEGLKFYRNPDFKESVTWFYTQITGDKVVTEAILMAADENDIPLSLAFALAYSESSYNVKAVNRNSNHTIDRGLFQLNNNSFPGLREDEFFDPYVSAKYGLSHLRFCLDTAGNEVAALAMYNAGTRRVKNGETPQVTLNYVSKIMNYRNGVDDLFAFQSETWLNSSLFEAIAMLK